MLLSSLVRYYHQAVLRNYLSYYYHYSANWTKTHSKQTYMTYFNIITTSHPYPQYLYHVICVKVKKKQQIKSVVPHNKKCTHMTWWKQQCSLLQQYLNTNREPRYVVAKPSCCSISHAAHGVTLACYRDDTLCYLSEFINTYPPAMVHVFRQLSTPNCLFR